MNNFSIKVVETKSEKLFAKLVSNKISYTEKQAFFKNMGLNETEFFKNIYNKIKELVDDSNKEVLELSLLAENERREAIAESFGIISKNKSVTDKIANYKLYPTSICFNYWCGCVFGCTVAYPQFSLDWADCIAICDLGYTTCWILAEE